MSKAFLAVALTTKGLTLGVGDGVGVGVGVGVAFGLGVGSTGLNTGLGDGFGTALIATPLFQTSFVPDLMQVNFLPKADAVAPALAHLVPALTAANVGAEIIEIERSSATKIRVRIITKRYQESLRTGAYPWIPGLRSIPLMKMACIALKPPQRGLVQQ